MTYGITTYGKTLLFFLSFSPGLPAGFEALPAGSKTLSVASKTLFEALPL